VSRGQATVEYALLVVALVVAVCLLVRFATPVTDVPGAPESSISLARPRRTRLANSIGVQPWVFLKYLKILRALVPVVEASASIVTGSRQCPSI